MFFIIRARKQQYSRACVLYNKEKKKEKSDDVAHARASDPNYSEIHFKIRIRHQSKAQQSYLYIIYTVQATHKH